MQTEGINSLTQDKAKSKQELSPREKILLEKRLDYVPSSSHRGPNLELFFHELIGNETLPKKIVNNLGGTFGLLLFAVTYPLIGLLLLFTSGRGIIRRDTCLGLHGVAFIRYSYNIFDDSGLRVRGAVGKFLYTSGLYRLPRFINFAKREMDLVGPAALNTGTCNQLNDRLTDFYKRFAVKPGIIQVGSGDALPESTSGTMDAWEELLAKELYYVARPTLKKDLIVVGGSIDPEKLNIVQ